MTNTILETTVSCQSKIELNEQEKNVLRLFFMLKSDSTVVSPRAKYSHKKKHKQNKGKAKTTLIINHHRRRRCGIQ